MRRVLFGLFLGLLFLVFSPYSSYAEMCGCMGKMGGDVPMMGGMKQRGMGMMGAEHRMWRGLRGLGLDEKQKEEIKEIKSRVMKDTIRKRSDLQVARIELKDILDKDAVDMNAAEAKLKQISSMLTDMRLSHIKAMEEVKAKLTPEQRKKFKGYLERHRKGVCGRMGMTPPRGKKEEMPATEHMRH